MKVSRDMGLSDAVDIKEICNRSYEQRFAYLDPMEYLKETYGYFGIKLDN